MSTNCNGLGASMESKVVANIVARGLKKGPWTNDEDAILMKYVKEHGEGSWNSIQKNSGLMRCGKSCRLRWANHLRPNLKKESFSSEEEKIIINLHAKLGNKWARMASQLPGRTDNEIKNFWNTRLKRRQRAGLPIYPKEESTTMHPQNHQLKHPNPSSFSSLVSTHNPDYNPSIPIRNTITFIPPFGKHQNNFNNSQFYSNPTLHFNPLTHNTNTNIGLPFSQVSFNQNYTDQSITRTPPLLQYNNVDFDNSMSFTSLIMGDHQQTIFIPNLRLELPSNQTPPPRPNTTFLSNTSNGVFLLENEPKENRSNGLLDDLLMESQNLVRKENLIGILDKGKRKTEELSDEKEEEEGNKRFKLSSSNSGIVSNNDDITSSQSSIGMKLSEELMEEMNSMDDDLLSLLDNFPTTTPLPEWYRKRNVSDGISSGLTGDAHQNESPTRPVSTDEITANYEWGLGSSSSCWNDFPSS